MKKPTMEQIAEAVFVRDLIHKALPGPRIEWPTRFRCVVYVAPSHTPEQIMQALARDAERELEFSMGSEYSRKRDELQTVRVCKIGPVEVRVVDYPIPTKALERRIRVPKPVNPYRCACGGRFESPLISHIGPLPRMGTCCDRCRKPGPMIGEGPRPLSRPLPHINRPYAVLY